MEVDEFIVAGGAQAIGALAYGRRTRLEPVDKIVGPGNAWVTAAKLEVCGEVGIDMPAGPTEGLVVADDSGPRSRGGRPHHPGRARPRLPGHARHDRRSFADAVEAEVRRASRPRPVATSSRPPWRRTVVSPSRRPRRGARVRR